MECGNQVTPTLTVNAGTSARNVPLITVPTSLNAP